MPIDIEFIKMILSVVSVLMILLSYYFYIRDTIKKKTKPHIFTWGLWSLIVFILFLLQLNAGGGFGSIPTLFVSLLCLVVFILGYIKQADKNIKKIDIVFLIITIAVIPLWILAKTEILSTILLITVYSLAGEATFRKSWEDPYSETLSLWLINSIRAILSIVAVSQYNFVSLAFPVLVFVSAFGFFLILVLRRKYLAKHK